MTTLAVLPWDHDPLLIRVARRADGPVVATAIHDGHSLHPSVACDQAITPPERLREEDPFTGDFATVGHCGVTIVRSRFEFDANRSRAHAVYQSPSDCWGLRVWKSGAPNPAVIQRSLMEYDAFYGEMRRLLSGLARRHGFFVVYDLHSYNHRREGVPADPAENPTVNLGTGSLDRARWGGVVEAFLTSIRSEEADGALIDARENVRFRGGYFPRWVNETFEGVGCALAIEIKKIYMDELTGEPRVDVIHEIRRALLRTLPPVVSAARSIALPRPAPSRRRFEHGGRA
jgi:N-formylglutamate deformylase